MSEAREVLALAPPIMAEHGNLVLFSSGKIRIIPLKEAIVVFGGIIITSTGF